MPACERPPPIHARVIVVESGPLSAARAQWISIPICPSLSLSRLETRGRERERESARVCAGEAFPPLSFALRRQEERRRPRRELFFAPSSAGDASEELYNGTRRRWLRAGGSIQCGEVLMERWILTRGAEGIVMGVKETQNKVLARRGMYLEENFGAAAGRIYSVSLKYFLLQYGAAVVIEKLTISHPIFLQ